MKADIEKVIAIASGLEKKHSEYMKKEFGNKEREDLELDIQKRQPEIKRVSEMNLDER